MSQSEIQARIIELDQQIAKLPLGSITKKDSEWEGIFLSPLDTE